MCRRPTAALLLALILSVIPCLAWLKPALGTASAETCLERFPIAKNACCLLIPVEIKGKRYQFALDTGAEYTLYDVSLRHLLGDPLRNQKVETVHGITTIPVFRPPDAKIGKLPLPQDSPVFVANLETLRQASDKEIYGLVGMNFLGKHVLRIDFDRGEVVFLSSIGPNAGERLPLSFRHNIPHLPIQIAGKEDPELFMLDTGMGGLDSGDMRAELFDELIRKKKMSSIVRGQGVDLSGIQERRQGRVESISFANHRHEHLLFSRSGRNLLGLRFCSRYMLTCDFPNRSLYVKKGRRFDWSDKQNLSGLHILRVKGEARVAAVDKGSPAAVAGLQPLDVLLTINDEKVSAISLSAVRERFCSEGKQIHLLIRRGAEQRGVSFNLPKAG